MSSDQPIEPQNKASSAMTNTPKQYVDAAPFYTESARAQKEYGRFNLAIIGGTGVGKSSLLNAVFGSPHAPVGIGLPVTQGVSYYHDGALGIWDFEGFEIGSAAHPVEQLRTHLDVISREGAEKQISVVWYCVASTASRITQTDIDLIRGLHSANLPVILVLTKVAWIKHPVTGAQRAPQEVEQFRDWLLAPTDHQGQPIYLPLQDVILTSSQGPKGKGSGHGLGELVTETLALAPEENKDAFRIVQRLNLPWKRELARPIIRAATTAAAGAAAVPIPVADAITIAPIQMAMMGRIAVIYGLDMRSVLSASAVAQFGAQMAGQALARSFLKLIPGAGVVINASVAAALTAAMGEAWMRFCEHLHQGKIDPARMDEAWKNYAPSAIDVVKKMIERGIRK